MSTYCIIFYLVFITNFFRFQTSKVSWINKVIPPNPNISSTIIFSTTPSPIFPC